MARDRLTPKLDTGSASTMVQMLDSESSSGLEEKGRAKQEKDITESQFDQENVEGGNHTTFEKEVLSQTAATYSTMAPPSAISLTQKLRTYFGKGGKLRPFRLLKQDVRNIRRRYVGDWTLFNQLVFASAVYVFFTNILPGITFASDLYVRTGMNWGTIEVVFSTGLCGVIFSL